MFSGYKIFKYKHTDELRDIQITIDYMMEIPLKNISIKNNISISSCRRRINKIKRKLRVIAIRFDKKKYEDVFYSGVSSVENRMNEKEILIFINLLEKYKEYCTESINNGTLYKPFKKEILNEIKSTRIICDHCCGKGYINDRSI